VPVGVALGSERAHGAYRHESWALRVGMWLAGPVAATALAAVWTWWRGRPAKVPGPKRAMAEHHAYLEALRQTAVATGDARHDERKAAAQARRSPSSRGRRVPTVTR